MLNFRGVFHVHTPQKFHELIPKMAIFKIRLAGNKRHATKQQSNKSNTNDVSKQQAAKTWQHFECHFGYKTCFFLQQNWTPHGLFSSLHHLTCLPFSERPCSSWILLGEWISEMCLWTEWLHLGETWQHVVSGERFSPWFWHDWILRKCFWRWFFVSFPRLPWTPCFWRYLDPKKHN